MSRSTTHPTLDVTHRQEGDSLRLVVEGELDRENAWALTAAVIRANVVGAPRRLLVDLSGLEFVDAGGLRVLADAARRARAHGRTLELANPSEPVARLLRLTGLDRSVDVVEVRNGR